MPPRQSSRILTECERPEDANGDVGDAEPGDVMVFMAALLVSVLAVVALLYGFFWLVWAGN